MAREEALRAALLQRLADDIAILRGFEAGELYVPGLASCCWLSFEIQEPHRVGYGTTTWAHQLCSSWPKHCGHAHHRTEVWMA